MTYLAKIEAMTAESLDQLMVAVQLGDLGWPSGNQALLVFTGKGHTGDDLLHDGFQVSAFLEFQKGGQSPVKFLVSAQDIPRSKNRFQIGSIAFVSHLWQRPIACTRCPTALPSLERRA